MTADDFFDMAKKNEAGMVDLKFVDLLGSWQHRGKDFSRDPRACRML